MPTNIRAPRPIGRPRKDPASKMVLVPTFRLPPDLAIRFAQLGGRDWLIDKLRKTKPHANQ